MGRHQGDLQVKARGARRAGALLAVGLVALLAGCGGDETCDCRPPYPVQDSPASVLQALERSWRERNLDEYSKLLADDFRFHFDAGTRVERGLPDYWTTPQESVAVGKVFSSDLVSSIVVNMKFNPDALPDTRTGHGRWVYIQVTDVHVEVDLRPTTEIPEGITFLIDGQRQRYYFRTGLTESDTLAASPTAGLYYLVEWWDYGLDAPAMVRAPRTSVERITWSGIKTTFH